MGNIKQENIESLFESLNRSKLDKKGYILLPTPEGFNFFEINEDRLNLYLQAENLYRSSIELIKN